jgi:hypothetical protein
MTQASYKATLAEQPASTVLPPLLWLLAVAGVIASVSILASAISDNGIGFLLRHGLPYFTT